MVFKNSDQKEFIAICNNASLSTDARWFLWYLLTNQVNDLICVGTIQSVSGWGRDKTYKVIKELIAARHLVKHQERGERGQFVSNFYDVHEVPLAEKQAMNGGRI